MSLMEKYKLYLNETMDKMFYFYSLKDEFSLSFFLTVSVCGATAEKADIMTKSLHTRLGGLD